MNSGKDSSQNRQEVIIAILDDETGKWEYISFETREQARQAVNEARGQGKAAVLYSSDNDENTIPPEL